MPLHLSNNCDNRVIGNSVIILESATQDKQTIKREEYHIEILYKYNRIIL